MRGDDAAVSFVVDYEVSADDLRERDILGRSAAWRAKPLWSRLTFPVLALGFVAETVWQTCAVSGCFTPQIAGSLDVWVWQCHTAVTPSSLLWQNSWPFAVGGAVLALALTELARAWARPLRWLYRRSMKEHGLQGRYRYEVAADGLTAAGPDGTIVYVPWPAFTAVRETRERFFLARRGDGWGWMLPKRGLADQSSVQQLGEFLRASVGREPPPA
jgi:hypothetical protein